MDLATGKVYATRAEALEAGASPADVVDIREMAKPLKSEPIQQLAINGPFKGRRYQKNSLGQLVRMR